MTTRNRTRDSKPAMPARAAAADWSLQPRGPVSAAGMGALALAAASVAGGPVFHINPGWAVGGTMLGAALTVLTGLNTPPKSLGWRLYAWLTGGGWLTWTLMGDLAALEPWLVLGGISMTAGMTYTWAHTTKPRPSMTGHHRNGPLSSSPQLSASVPRKSVPLAEEWVARIARVGDLRVTIEDWKEWEHGGGFSALVGLPPGGANITTLDNKKVALAADADLPDGCTVEFRGSGRRRSVWMDVATVNKLAEVIDHPGDYSPRDITHGITLGTFRNGEPMTVQMREPRTIVVGTTGSGKTGVLHTATSELGRCFNNVVFHMDLNGGGISQPWLRAWLDGHTERPAVDYAAGCPQEALLMADAMVKMALARKTAYAELRMSADEDKLPVSAEVPQVTTVLDEGFEVLSDTIRDPIQKAIRAKVEEAVRIGRAEAVQLLASALRSTSNTVSPDLLSRMHNRIWMAGGEQKEAEYLYNYPRGLSVKDDLAGPPGNGYVRRFRDDTVRTWRAWRMRPQRDIRPASLAIADRRPDLDAATAQAAGDGYATRLVRMRWCFSTPAQRDHLERPEPIELPGMFEPSGEPMVWDPTVTHPAASDMRGQLEVRPDPPKPVRRSDSDRHLHLLQGGAASSWASPETIAAAAASHHQAAGAAPMRTTAAAAAAPVWSAEHVTAIPAAGPVLAVGDDLPEIVLRVLRALRKSARGRLHSEVLAARVGVGDASALAALLSPLGLTPLPNSFKQGGAKRRGYALSAAEQCAARIARGETRVPEEVAAWPDDGTEDSTEDPAEDGAEDGAEGE